MPPDPELLLKEEYFKLQDMIESFDQRALQIKGWSVTVSLAGMAAALIAKDVTADVKALAFLVSSCAAIAFWIVEFSWKRFQWAFYPRADAIERHFRDGEPAIRPLQIGASFKEGIRLTARDVIRPFFPFLMLPHALIAALGVYLAAVFWNADAQGTVTMFGVQLQSAAAADAPSGTCP